MIVFKFSPLFRIYSAESINKQINAVGENDTKEIIQTIISLQEKSSNGIVDSDQVLAELAVDDSAIMEMLRKMKKSGYVYIERYRPNKVCILQDSYLKALDENNLELTPFAKNVSELFQRYGVPLSKEDLVYLNQIKDDAQAPNGIILEVYDQLLDMDKTLTAYEIASLFHVSSAWKTRIDVKTGFEKYKTNYQAVKKLLRKFGRNRKPEEKEIELYLKWTEVWGFDQQEIEKLCDNIVNADYPLEYLDAMLNNMKAQKSNGLTVEEVLEIKEQLKLVFNKIGEGRMNEWNINFFKSIKEDFPDMEIILFAASELGRQNFREQKLVKLQSLLNEWKKNGLQSLEEIKDYQEKENRAKKIALSIFEIANVNRPPRRKDIQRIRTWMDDYNMDEKTIESLAERCRDTTNIIAYIDKIIREDYDPLYDLPM